MMNPAKLNLQGKSGYVWFGTSVLCWIAAYYNLPECKGRTYRELDVLFGRKVPARDFSKTIIGDYEDE